jgi:type IV pilus assembly protein PilF
LIPFRLFIAALTVMLAGCAGNPSIQAETASDSLAHVEQAMSAQNPVTDSRQRAKAHTELGQMYLKQGRFDVALDEAKIALEAEGGYAPAYNLSAQTYMAMRQDGLADASFNNALRLAPNDPEINNNYGWFLCLTGKVKQSFAHFDVALKNPLYQTPELVLNNAGVCHMMNQDDVKGESYLLRSLKLNPNNLRAYYLLADIEYRRGRFEDARDWLKKLHGKIEPTPETVWLSLRIDRKLGDRKSEAANMGVLRSKFRDSPEYVLMMRGEFD